MNPEPLPRRRLLHAAGALLALGAGAGCASSPPLRLHHLPLPPPEDLPPTAATGPIWELVMRVALPAYLDRDLMLVDRGQGRVDALPGQRWAEPLPEAVPRLLLHDLALLRGTNRVWPAPAPTAAGAALRLRVEITALQAEPARQRLRLLARWTLESRTERPFAHAGAVDLAVPLASAEASTLVQAHRLVLWRMAQRIVAEAVA